MNVNFVSDLNITVSTTLKYHQKEGIYKKPKLMWGAMKFLKKKNTRLWNI